MARLDPKKKEEMVGHYPENNEEIIRALAKEVERANIPRYYYLAGQMIIEYALNIIMKYGFPKGLKKYQTIRNRLDFLFISGYISDVQRKEIGYLSDIRNKVAHTLDFEKKETVLYIRNKLKEIKFYRKLGKKHKIKMLKRGERTLDTDWHEYYFLCFVVVIDLDKAVLTEMIKENSIKRHPEFVKMVARLRKGADERERRIGEEMQKKRIRTGHVTSLSSS